MNRIPLPASLAADILPAIVSFPTAEVAGGDSPAMREAEKFAPCELTAAFMSKFEKISGWEIQFSESSASGKKRAESDLSQAAQGQFEIIDLSVDWPAKKPALHRGECDELIALFSKLVAKQNLISDDLQRTRTTLESLTNNSAGDEELVDSFLPLGPPSGEQGFSEDDDWVLGQHGTQDDSDFIVQQAVDSDWLTNGGAWSDWSVAGETGLAGNRYLDWTQSPEKVTVFVGRLESSLGAGDAESRLDVYAESQRFRVTDDSRLSAFFVWDRRGSRLEKVVADTWLRLPPGGAVVVSTTPELELPSKVRDLDRANVTAEQLAAAIENQMIENERLLVIKYL